MRTALLPVVCTLALAATPARAAESYDNCAGTITSLPAVIDTQGVWCLKSDLSTAITTGEAIRVEANNVTIDCNGFKIGGLAGGTATGAWGINANLVLNTTIRGCNVRGFFYAVVLGGGGGHVVEDNRFDGSTFAGLYSSSDGVTIQRNQFVDTGGSTIISTAYGMHVSGFSHIADNSIFGVSASGGSTAIGISMTSPGSIVDNRVSGVTSPTGLAHGIAVQNNYGLVADNYIYGNVGQTDTGIHCSNTSTIARNNSIAETVTGITNCASFGNVVQL